jgi:hypothetical protein
VYPRRDQVVRNLLQSGSHFLNLVGPFLEDRNLGWAGNEEPPPTQYQAPCGNQSSKSVAFPIVRNGSLPGQLVGRTKENQWGQIPMVQSVGRGMVPPPV